MPILHSDRPSFFLSRPVLSISLVIAISFASLLAGCGSSASAEKKPLYTVTGSLLINGKPASGARIILAPEEDDVPTPAGQIKEDGTFSLTVYDDELRVFEVPGDPVGEYSVLVLMPREPGVFMSPDRLGCVYSKKENAKHKVQIELGENRLDPIRIDNAKIQN
jgi:hypothetical protein